MKSKCEISYNFATFRWHCPPTSSQYIIYLKKTRILQICLNYHSDYNQEKQYIPYLISVTQYTYRQRKRISQRFVAFTMVNVYMLVHVFTNSEDVYVYLSIYVYTSVYMSSSRRDRAQKNQILFYHPNIFLGIP